METKTMFYNNQLDTDRLRATSIFCDRKEFDSRFNQFRPNLEEEINRGLKLAELSGLGTIEASGVIVAVRRMGKIAFVKIMTTTGSLQIVLRASEFDSQFKELVGELLLGTHIRVYGFAGMTATKEMSIVCEICEVLQQPRMSFPDKWNGVSNEEKRRLRYQECLVDQVKHNVFIQRQKFINVIRQFLQTEMFLEVETPILHKVSAGAQARPFTTACNALGEDAFLRIAPETYLKRMTAGGFQKIFEIGKQFRNEGIDSSHMPEFTSCEWYEAYTTADDQIMRFNNLLYFLEAHGFTLPNGCENAIAIKSYGDLIKQYCDIDVETYDGDIDELFKKRVRPNIIVPTIVKDYPSRLAPLAKTVDGQDNIAEMWQFIWNGQEIVKCYTELTEPSKQRELLEAQALARQNGDVESMMLDEAFLATMEFGMPPQAGVGIGIDRFFALYMGIEDIRDTVFFSPGA